MMDRLRHDLRAVYGRQQEGLGDLAASRRRVMRSALDRRDEPIGGRMQLAAGIAAVVIAILVVATFAYVRAGSRTHLVAPAVTSPSPSPTGDKVLPPIPSPIPASPNPTAQVHRIDIDLLDAAKAWALTSNCDPYSGAACNYSVAATVDGGRTWSKAVHVGPSFDPTNGDAPRTIRFVNVSDGFVYGGGGAFATHDGGRTWNGLDLHATFVNAISGLGKTVWAVTYPCAKGTSCSYELRASSDGGRSWSAPQSLPIGFSPFDLSLFATSGLIVTSLTGDMEITADGAKTWRAIASRCSNNPFRAWVATADGNELWELCIGNPQATAPDFSDKVLYVSEDGGYTWSQAGTSRAGGTLPVVGTQVSILSTGLHALLFGTDKSQLLLTTDTGSTWTQVPSSPSSGVGRIRFVSPQVGWAKDTIQGAIWITTDGGLSWTQLPAYTPSAQQS